MTLGLVPYSLSFLVIMYVTLTQILVGYSKGMCRKWPHVNFEILLGSELCRFLREQGQKGLKPRLGGTLCLKF